MTTSDEAYEKAIAPSMDGELMINNLGDPVAIPVLGPWRLWEDDAIQIFWQGWYDRLCTTTEPQTRGTLWQVNNVPDFSHTRTVGKCCLGIGGDVLEEVGGGMWSRDVRTAGNRAFIFFSGYVNQDLSAWPDEFCLKIKMPVHVRDRYVRYNDNYHMTFKQIAREVRADAYVLGRTLTEHPDE